MSVTFLFVAVIGKLVYVQIVNGENLQVLALDQWTRDVPLEAERGKIYDRNGVLLAASATTYTVYVRPNSVTDKDKLASVLSAALGLDEKTLREKLNTRTSEITVKKNVDKDTMQLIKNSGADGIYFSQTQKRVYPYGDFMSQVLGFTNVDCDGQSGLEQYYNEELSGMDGYILTETDLIGRELEENVTHYVSGTSGLTAYLTIDYNIQAFAESAVTAAYLKHNAKSVSCAVMNINTGEILALAQKPSFDLNNVPRDDVAALLAAAKCGLVTNVFEPGSTFKIITAGVGLDTGAVTRNTTCYCNGYHIIDGQRIKCWKTRGHGSQTFDEGVQNSCNVLFMNTALAIGTETFYNYIEKLGLTQKTGIDIIGEASGLRIAEESVKNVDLARIGFGQAIAVTPIELLCAAGAIINGGTLVTPYILDRLEDATGTTVVRNYPDLKTGMVKAETSAAMREILESVVTKGGGKNAAVEGYRIGGKTGTAQKYENGVIAQGKYVSTFLGFAPADNPQYILLFIVDEPTGGAYYGSIVAAPYAGEIFSKIKAYTA